MIFELGEHFLPLSFLVIFTDAYFSLFGRMQSSRRLPHPWRERLLRNSSMLVHRQSFGRVADRQPPRDRFSPLRYWRLWTRVQGLFTFLFFLTSYPPLAQSCSWLIIFRFFLHLPRSSSQRSDRTFSSDTSVPSPPSSARCGRSRIERTIRGRIIDERETRRGRFWRSLLWRRRRI